MTETRDIQYLGQCLVGLVNRVAKGGCLVGGYEQWALKTFSDTINGQSKEIEDLKTELRDTTYELGRTTDNAEREDSLQAEVTALKAALLKEPGRSPGYEEIKAQRQTILELRAELVGAKSNSKAARENLEISNTLVRESRRTLNGQEQEIRALENVVSSRDATILSLRNYNDLMLKHKHHMEDNPEGT